jgi:phosphoribosylformylglycinamidine cyclo-ligase
MAKKLTYKDAGVDIESAQQAKDRIKELVRGTFTSGVLGELGGFGGLFSADFPDLENPVLVSSADGVGTKLKVAMMTGVHDTVGYDLVSHCVNDILVHGARPLFFLDYIGTGKMDKRVIGQIVSGLVRGCRDSETALIGGETAEMPGFYGDGEYDLVGFIVGVVGRGRILDGSKIRTGDILVGLPSLGLHTNGFSLARKIFFEQEKLRADTFVEAFGRTVGEELLSLHRPYYRAVRDLAGSDDSPLHGMAHITGGGLTDNLPRMLPPGCDAAIRPDRWTVPPVFSFLKEKGGMTDAEMFRTFNMGIGYVLIIPPDAREKVVGHLARMKEPCIEIGRIVDGDKKVVYEKKN